MSFNDTEYMKSAPENGVKKETGIKALFKKFRSRKVAKPNKEELLAMLERKKEADKTYKASPRSKFWRKFVRQLISNTYGAGKLQQVWHDFQYVTKQEQDLFVAKMVRMKTGE